eukprot:Skav224384  [mRNA]  locus=scaffold1155:266176:271252:+ [translate_table: standard]
MHLLSWRVSGAGAFAALAKAFQAILPPFQNGDLDGGSWSYTNADGSCHTCITLEGPRKRKPLQTERLNGPRKQWTDKGHSFIRPLAATQIDVSDSEKEESKDMKESPNDNSPRTTQQSGSNKRQKNVLPANDWLAQSHPQWQIWDDGGSGDCGFRSIAVMQGKEYESTKVISEASRLRTLCVGHLLKNTGDYEDFFAPDPQATADQRDGNPEPDSFSDYITLASRKQFWIDGLMLMELSHRLGRPIVVFVWSNRDRHVLAPSFDKQKAKSPSGIPVCVLLKSGHYRALVRGAGTSKPSCPSLSIPPSTPKAIGVQRKSLVESTPCRQAGSNLSLPGQTPVRSSKTTRKSTGERLPAISLVSKKRSRISEPSPETRREERFKRYRAWLTLAKKHGWAGLHQLMPAPSLRRRKQIWQTCLRVAAQRSKVADGMIATRRGKRACKVGEASHPAPSDHNLLLWAVNVRSWNANLPHHLDGTAKHGVSVVFFQETNLSENACPSVSQACASKGWQILLCPTASNTTNRGGVAIAVRLPFALSFRSQSGSPESQTLTAVLHGGQHTISLAVRYRRPSAKKLDGVTNIINRFEACRDMFWIVAMDSNTNPGLTLQFPRRGLATRFARTRTLCSREPAPVSWGPVASSNADWAASLIQVEIAWNVWARDVEAWMTEARILDQREIEKFLAQEPKLRAGAHRLGSVGAGTEESVKLQQWKENIHTMHGACQWAKKVEAAPSAVSVGDQALVVSPAQVAAALTTSWKGFSGHTRSLLMNSSFWKPFLRRFLRSMMNLPLPSIAVEEIKKAARKMACKAAGPDGFQAEFLLLLPDIALSFGRVVFLP